MAGHSRRQFLHGTAKAFLAGGAACAFHGCSPSAPPFTPYQGGARVAAVRGLNLRTMTREALEAFGGAGAIVHEGEMVFIKPNFGAVGMVRYNPFEAGDSAKPEIVATVAEECLRAGAREVIIAEGGQAKSWDWGGVTTLDGLTNLEAEVERMNGLYTGKARLVCLNSETPSYTKVPSHSKFSTLLVPDLMLSADKVISIPVIKTHRWTQITVALKNFVGTTSTRHYGLGVQWRFLLHDAGIEQCFLDIVRAVRPDFTIIDGSICCEGNGPHVMPGYWGTTVDMRDRLGSFLLLASDDPVAADATMARVITQDMDKIPHLFMAYHQGLGQMLKSRISMDGATLDELMVDWQPPEHTEGFREVLLPGLRLIT